MRLPDSFIQQVLDRNDIEQVVSSYVALKRRGRNLVGLCPFHGEKTPSFTLYPENGSFYCFGCGAGGDVITFVRRIEHLDYLDAVKWLADKAGLPMPENVSDDKTSRLRVRVLEANREAARLYHRILYAPEGRAGLDYYHRRGYTDATIRHFGLGYAPPSGNPVLRALREKGFHDEELEAAFLCRRKEGSVYDLFRNRVMIPIIDIRGNVIAFGGRVLDDSKPKYLNSADTPAFRKSENLFALNFAKNNAGRSFILCEGYMDVIALHQAGFPQAVAALGTSFTEEHARLLARYTGDAGEVTLIFDADGAGKKGTQRAIDLLRAVGVRVRVVTIPDGKDPDEFIRRHSPERFRLLLEGAVGDMGYRLAELRLHNDLNTPEGKVRYMRQATDLIAGLDSPVEREVYAGQVAAQMSVQKSTLLEQIRQTIERRERGSRKTQMARIVRRQQQETVRANPEAAAHPRAAAAEESLIGLLLQNPDSIAYVARQLDPSQMITPLGRDIYARLVDRQQKGLMVDLAYLSADYDEAQMAYITSMLQAARDRVNSLEEADRYIAVLRQEQAASLLARPEELTPEQIREQLALLRKER
ncbi:MAG: DNA primase [Clostridia bacterium]|nr:DNA primase [Clostridia bacterium]